MPTDFPPLLIVPAFALDLVLQPARGRINDRVLALLASAVFLVTFLAVEYPFANFLMTWRSAALTNYTVFV